MHGYAVLIIYIQRITDSINAYYNVTLLKYHVFTIELIAKNNKKVCKKDNFSTF